MSVIALRMHRRRPFLVLRSDAAQVRWQPFSVFKTLIRALNSSRQFTWKVIFIWRNVRSGARIKQERRGEVNAHPAMLSAMFLPQNSRRDILVGSWSLLEYKTTKPDGEDTIYPMGKSPRGFLMYTPDGYMSAQLLSQSPKVRLSTEFAVDDYVAYSGQFELDECPEENCLRVNHLVSVASFPDWIGQVQSRFARYDEDKRLLELSTISPIFLAVSDNGFDDPRSLVA